MDSDWLRGLPHRIPFRAASSLNQIDQKTVEGLYYHGANDELSEGLPPSDFMIYEAMAQIGGVLAFRDSGIPGYLSAIDSASIDGPLELGDVLRLRVMLDAEFGRIFRFSGTATREGTEFARARFYLAAPEPTENA